MGAITLGRHLGEHITNVAVENLFIKNWYQNGISTPTNLELEGNGNLISIAQAPELPDGQTFTGTAISIGFEDVDLSEGLARIAADAGASVDIQEGIGGRITLILKDVPWDQALHTIAWANNITMTRKDDVVRFTLE